MRMVQKNLAIFISYCCFVLLNLTIFVESSDQYKIVKTRDGDVRGKLLFTLIDEKPYFSFKGIPYAKPPLGNLRFKAPQKPDPWSDVKDVFEYRSECTQKNMLTKVAEGSENCLFLNVFVPVIPPQRKLSVMVYIHGGGFNSGTGNLYGPDFILDNNVILVTLNYRLGPFGFLSLGTPEYSGNMGLKDQLEVLKWVNENIENFGGNKSSITIFGQSAGGASTHFHTILPASRGLFHRSIPQSGSILNPWAYNLSSSNFEHLHPLFKKTKVNVNNKEELVKFIQNVDAVELLKETFKEWFDTGLARKEIILIWCPVVEVPNAISPIITENPSNYLFAKSVKNIDTFFGYTNAEMYGINGVELLNPDLIKPFDEKFEIQPPLQDLSFDYALPEYKALAARVRDYYFGKEGKVGKNTLVELNNLLSDLYMTIGIDKSAKLQSKRSTGNTYFYMFSYVTDINIYKKFSGALALHLPGATHSDDLFYLFRMDDPALGNAYENLLECPTKIKLIRDITKLWTNFAKYGNPTHGDSSVQLKPVRNNVVNYVELKNEGLFLNSNPYSDRVKFWKDLLKEFDFSSGSQPNKDEL